MSCLQLRVSWFGVQYSFFNTSHFLHTVSAPTVSLDITPTGHLLAGGAEDITLTCSALLDLTVVDTQQDILYSFTWRDRAGVEIVSGDRIVISQSSSTTAFSLTLSPLTTMDTNFTCTVLVSVPLNTLLPSDSAMASISLDVEGELCPPSLCVQSADCPSPH